MSTFMLEILAPDKAVFWGMAESVTARAIDGEFQILPGHAPYVNVLVPGEIKVHAEDNRQLSFQGGDGIVEVAKDKTSLLIFSPLNNSGISRE